MKYIAIIGYGVVGSGITAVLEANRSKISRVIGDDIEVRYILDLREFPGSPYGERVVHDISVITGDPEVELVCETMGGSHPAYEFSVACMKAKKCVVTSNKEVVANYGDMLLECAAENGVSYLFEASVGGGIPVIRSLNTSMSQDNISRITGIVNGTTNYILTAMKNEGRDFADVLSEAQRLGYAERDPSADIDAIDAKRKIIILIALATVLLLPDDKVYAGSIRKVEVEDIRAADRLGYSLKLVASFCRDGNGMVSFAAPAFVPMTSPISSVDGVYNGIWVRSDTTGDVMYYGMGAGSLPTAGAVMADVCAALSGAAAAEYVPVFRKSNEADGIIHFRDTENSFYLRYDGTIGELEEALKAACPGFRGTVRDVSCNGSVTEVIIEKITLSELEKVTCSSLPILILQ